MVSTSSILQSSIRPLRIGMIGAGTVGGGVYEIIMNRLGSRSAGNNTTASGAKKQVVITKICVRDPTKPRDFQNDKRSTEIVTDINSIVNDKDIDLVVEVMGGTSLAKSAVLESLKQGKSVVTANKALIAENLEEIVGVLNQVNERVVGKEAVTAGDGGNVKFAYEASVCGGIPVIQVLQSCYTGDIINEVMGICNGTTNFMLGKMEAGADYDEVLKEAQDLGFAEADPSADVDGYDVRAKIAILAKLAFGTTVPVDTIPCMGITNISVIDFAYAKSMGCTIKLVGTAVRQSQFGEHDGALSVYVSPKLVPNTHLLASATGCGNAVAIDSANLGIASYTGPGAGRYATANSIVADILRVANNTSTASPFPFSSNIEIDNDYVSAFYIRISFQDGLGIIRRIGELSESQEVSIHSILQQPITDRMAADTVVTTEACKYSQVKALCELIEKEDFALCAPVFMPMFTGSEYFCA
mmetsp:Transcript_12526/g.26591  ORF Transcript_12526/g.26591 Transcript_12526/m.26591 type:complete len:471 (-) Transcript_12526:67-1479(-)|eukprot:CAMPEP_0171330540 /NCGR_PEP_ID=MMETSP0878-20121228/2074_1 /TAXON_ID=67004 /ORGANISM="Thalassiosira weissflogii, Strain CCMP1336" /LENGTH=470 /DNA_ID=CAMNT_0011830857 /DNA_START=103 /DNA_END=1515 /DNA_ORIENTATION=+